MLYGSLTQSPNNTALLRKQKPFAAALEWLDRQDLSSIADGRYEVLPDGQLFALVMEYATVPAEESRFETHRRYVDLQITIAGAEDIEYHPAPLLLADGPFNAEKDLQFYAPVTAPMGVVRKSPGCYSIWFPEDAHRPKIAVPGSERVRKVVFKIALELF